MITLKNSLRKRFPREIAIRDMRKAGLDTSVLKLRKTVVMKENEDYIVRSIDDGRILNGGKRVKRTNFLERI